MKTCRSECGICQNLNRLSDLLDRFFCFPAGLSFLSGLFAGLTLPAVLFGSTVASRTAPEIQLLDLGADPQGSIEVAPAVASLFPSHFVVLQM